jgi:hypothetical protein
VTVAQSESVSDSAEKRRYRTELACHPKRNGNFPISPHIGSHPKALPMDGASTPSAWSQGSFEPCGLSAQLGRKIVRQRSRVAGGFCVISVVTSQASLSGIH